MRKLLLLLILGIFLISFASADVSIGTVKQGDSIQLTQTCSNCTYVNLTSVLYPNNNYALLGQYEMTKTDENFNYTWTNTSALGEYIYTTCGDLNGINTCQSVGFEVTGTGAEFSTAKSIFYLGLLCLLVFLFVVDGVLISKLPSGNSTSDSGKVLSISILKYLKATLVVAAWGLISSILFITSSIANNYLIEPAFYNFFFTLFRASTILAVPVLFVYAIWLVINAVQDNKFWKMMGRGIIPEQ